MNLRAWPRYPLQDEADPDKKGAGGGGEGEKKGGEGGGDADLGTVEERAARMGWVPKDKFRGDAAKWTDAASFVKNGEESLPILRERLRNSERTNAELAKSVKEVREQTDKVFERAYEKAKKDLKADVKAAAKAGDEAGADKAADELAQLEREKASRDAANKSDPVFDGWAAENDWYKDPEMAIEAEGEAFKLHKRMKAGKQAVVEGLPFLELVKDVMKKRFPEKFGNPRRQAAAGGGVERPGAGGDGGGKTKGWDQLPAVAKATGDRYVKQGLFKDRAAYAKQYFSDDEQQQPQ